ncbi:MAG: GNAT family N-acetyltransferase [Actinobacteria bacterium]|nr:GNAT family N-acetyltransferase [Actinomycetota bacterium]
MGILSAELITDVSRLAPFEDRWRELAVQRSNAFVTPEWFHGWWEHQGHDSSTPLVSVVRREDEVVGVMPLVVDRSSRPRAIRFAGASIGDRFHPAAARDDEVEVTEATIRAIESGGLGRNMLLFERTDAGASWWRTPCEGNSRRRTLVEQQRTGVPYVDLRGLDWDGYLACRSQKFRKRVRGVYRHLIDERGMTLRAADPATVATDLAELFRLHDLRRKGLGGSSLDAASRRSLQAFGVAACKRGWLRLIALESDGRQVASFLGWRVGDSFASYQGGFDPAWAKLGLGFALEAMTIRQAIEEGAAEYDFLLGTEDWKRRFTNLTRPSQTAILVGTRDPVRLLVAGETGLRRVGAGLSRWPAVGRLVRALHSVIPTVRRA